MPFAGLDNSVAEAQAAGKNRLRRHVDTVEPTSVAHCGRHTTGAVSGAPRPADGLITILLEVHRLRPQSVPSPGNDVLAQTLPSVAQLLLQCHGRLGHWVLPDIPYW